MCGLSASIAFAPSETMLDAILAMHGPIGHRGPDGEGFLLIGPDWRAVRADKRELREQAGRALRAALAFRWLHIQDPGEAASQPMGSADGSVWLIFNGEVYNFNELRGELQQRGRSFASCSDTEVILHAYLQWGTACFSRFDGMWAMILIDLRRRKLIVSRDRFGIKPLFCHSGANGWMFASEVKQLLAAGAPSEANRNAVERFVVGMRPSTPEQTFFAGITAQACASFAEIDLEDRSQTSSARYWRLEPPSEILPPPALAKSCEALDTLLCHSVRAHMVARMPRANLISGGLDSSLLAALAAPAYAERGERGVGVSMVMPGAPQYDETKYVDAVVASLGFKSFRRELSPGWLKANIERVTRAQEEPVAGAAVAAQFLAYETAAQNGARVVLDGQGADEIFGGYPRHQYTLLRDYLRRDPAAFIREVGSLARHDAPFLTGLAVRKIRSRILRTFQLDRGRHGPDFLRSPQQHRPPEVGNHLVADIPASALARELATDVLAGNLRSALAVTDRNSMAHSVEARVPYVDRAIVEFAFGLPDAQKVGGGRRKRVLRMVAERYLPRSVVTRRDRIGFGAPTYRWLLTDFREPLKDLVTDHVLVQLGLFDGTRLRAYLDEFLSGRHREAGPVWRLYALQQWIGAFRVKAL